MIVRETLWQLGDKLLALGEAVVEADELTPELEERLDRLEGDFAAKLEQCAQVRATLRGNSVNARAEVQRLEERARALDSGAAKLGRYMIREMQRTGQLKVTSHDGSRAWAVREGKGRVVIDDIGLLPDDLVRIERKAELAKVREWLMRGVVDGAHIVVEPWLDER